ncbi:bacterio-opsin activator [Halorhabdus sp. CBA1104]|nr:bacterio-opsin activator [Halorhabdus sp. CBA1104]
MHTFIAEASRFEQAELLIWNFSRSELDVLLFRVAGPIEPYREAIEDAQFVTEYDLTPIDDDSFYAYVEHETRDVDRRLRDTFEGKHVVLVPPVVYDADGTTRLRIVGRADALEAVVETVPDAIDVTVESIGEYRGPSQGILDLTDRQREVARTAVEMGYYDVPRDASVADVAARLDCAASTVSDHLRKAERAVMAGVFE